MVPTRSSSKNSEPGLGEKALACAVRALGRRDHSVAEIERKLRDREFPADITAEVVGRLVQSGYLDDRRFAERWAEAAVRNGRGYGPRIRVDLMRRGVNREIVDEVVIAIDAAHGEAETLAAILTRKFPAFDPQTATERDKRRLGAYLQRRGFSTAAIVRLFREPGGCRDY